MDGSTLKRKTEVDEPIKIIGVGKANEMFAEPVHERFSQQVQTYLSRNQRVATGFRIISLLLSSLSLWRA